MTFVATAIPGVVTVEPTVHRDERGFFVETYHEPRYRDNGIPEHFVQDNHSRSVRGILRGLHAQSPNPQGKLVTVIRGLSAEESDLPEVLARLKTACGAGGALKDDLLEIQGNHLKRIRELLTNIGYHVRG